MRGCRLLPRVVDFRNYVLMSTSAWSHCLRCVDTGSPGKLHFTRASPYQHEDHLPCVQFTTRSSRISNLQNTRESSISDHWPAVEVQLKEMRPTENFMSLLQPSPGLQELKLRFGILLPANKDCPTLITKGANFQGLLTKIY